MNFTKFRDAVNAQFNSMSGLILYRTDTTREEIWDTYLNSFAPGTNELFKVRRQYDCNCCKNFIRDIGNVVAIVNDQLVTIWDVQLDDGFNDVAKAMSDYVRSKSIRELFKAYEPKVSAKTTTSVITGTTETQSFSHMYAVIDKKFILAKDSIATYQSKISAAKQILTRGLKELNLDAINTVIDIINDNNLYRGTEHLHSLTKFKDIKLEYDALANDQLKELYIWKTVSSENSAAYIRNTSIGTLLIDISEGIELETAIRKFESIMAPANYKRSKAITTPAMVNKAVETIRELGYEESLQRRYARIEDISVNDVLFVDRASSVLMKDALTESLMAQTVKKATLTEQLGETIKIEQFISKVLPTIKQLEVLIENSHIEKLVSLIAPEKSDSKNILKWNNNFSWSYNGDATDSIIKQRVKNAGGNVTDPFRVSLSWFNYDDLDIHVKLPNRRPTIYFRNKVSTCGGKLDIDMNAGGFRSRSAVENVTWPDLNTMPDGEYLVVVDNYNKRENTDVGFELELCINGETTTYAYPKNVQDGKSVNAISITKNGFDFKVIVLDKNITTSARPIEIWGIKTQEFHKVKCVTTSPNYWEGNAVGNKHYMFMLDNCVRPEPAIGLYNEFITPELKDHRKVFEVLSGILKCKEQKDQFSGIGFSSTCKSKLTCRVETDAGKKQFTVEI